MNRYYADAMADAIDAHLTTPPETPVSAGDDDYKGKHFIRGAGGVLIDVTPSSHASIKAAPSPTAGFRVVPVESAEVVVSLSEAERVAQHAYIAGKRGYTFTGFIDELRSAAKPRSEGASDGWKAVPVEPTESMALAAAKSISGDWEDESDDVKVGLVEIQRAAIRDAIAAHDAGGV
jgi:hypothetical protein